MGIFTVQWKAWREEVLLSSMDRKRAKNLRDRVLSEIVCFLLTTTKC